MGSGNDGRTLTQTDGIWLSASRNLECSDMGETTITERPAGKGRASIQCRVNTIPGVHRRGFLGAAAAPLAADIPINGAAGTVGTAMSSLRRNRGRLMTSSY